MTLMFLGGVTPAAAHPGRSIYLALGDSISYGFQTSKALAGLPPTAFNTGYVDRVSEFLERRRRHVRTVNYGCPGEATTTINRPCVWRASGHALHDGYRVMGDEVVAQLRRAFAHDER